MSDTLRIGIIGAGGNTRSRHIPGLLEQDNVEIVAICNRSMESSQQACDQFNIKKACASPDEIFEADDIDAVVIGTWPYKHCEYTVASLTVGKHVMCEARMAMNADEAEQMVQASRANPKLIAQIVPAPFSLTVDDAICDIVKHRLGDVRSVRVSLLMADHGNDRPERNWRRNRAYSGNNILTVGIWYETMMRWVGPLTCVQARLATHRPLGVEPETGRPAVIDVPDHVEAIGKLANGGVFSLTAHTHERENPSDQITIYGNKGVIHYTPKQTVFTPHDGGPQTIHPDSSKDWRVEAEFINAIRGVEDIRLTDFDTGLAYMRFTDALHESHRLGQTVNISG